MKRSDVVNKINDLKGDNAHRWVVDTYNTIKPLPRGYKLQDDDPWCAATVSAVLHSLGYDDLAEVSCSVIIAKAKKLGIWVEDDSFRPKAGDLIIYDWQDNGKGDNVGDPDHIGIVVKVDGDKMIVREGNKKNAMGNRIVAINSTTIRGFITPPYSEESSETANTTPKEENGEEKANSGVKKAYYEVGKTYTVNVKTCLNVRRGAGKSYPLVGYAGLSANAKKHATKGGALKNGTRVDCLDLKQVGNNIWMLIPSGWICAEWEGVKYVK